MLGFCAFRWHPTETLGVTSLLLLALKVMCYAFTYDLITFPWRHEDHDGLEDEEARCAHVCQGW